MERETKTFYLIIEFDGKTSIQPVKYSDGDSFVTDSEGEKYPVTPLRPVKKTDVKVKGYGFVLNCLVSELPKLVSNEDE